MLRLAIAALLLSIGPASAQLMSECQSLPGDAFSQCLRSLSRDREQDIQLQEMRDRQVEIERERLWEHNERSAGPTLWRGRELELPRYGR